MSIKAMVLRTVGLAYGLLARARAWLCPHHLPTVRLPLGERERVRRRDGRVRRSLAPVEGGPCARDGVARGGSSTLPPSFFQTSPRVVAQPHPLFVLTHRHAGGNRG